MNRRAFLRTVACSAAGVALASGTRAEPLNDSATTPPKPSSAAIWQKHGIVIEATEPWEGSSVQNFTCPAEPLKDGSWRIWYSASESPDAFSVGYAEGVPGKPMKKVRAACSSGEPSVAPLSIGNLPEKWRPVQVVHIRLKNGKHRVYFWAHGPRILRYLVAESEDGCRYRITDPLRPILYHPSDRAAWGVASPDGLLVHPSQSIECPADEPLASSRLISNDASNIYQLADGTFELYSVGLVRVPKDDPAFVSQDNAPGLLRVIDRFTSPDGLHFETRSRIIQRDQQDPADQQFYYLSVTPTAKGRVGMLGHYRCQAQTMDLEWCFSADGVRWQRPLREPWIARGGPPAPDCYGIYAGSQLVQHDGLWHLFYTGVNSAHNGKHSYGRPRQVVMYATAESIWA